MDNPVVSQEVIHPVPRRGRPFNLSRTLRTASFPQEDLLSEVTKNIKATKALQVSSFCPYVSVVQKANIIEVQRNFVHGLSLNDTLSQTETTDTPYLLSLAIKIATAINEIHKQGFALKTLNPNNIIVCPNGEIKLVDVCYDFIFQDESINKVTPLTLLFQGPDQGKIEDSQPHDIWCFGLILYLMFNGKYPYSTSNSMRLFSQMQSEIIRFPPHVLTEIQILIRACLKKDPSQRPDSLSTLRELSLISPRFKHKIHKKHSGGPCKKLSKPKLPRTNSNYISDPHEVDNVNLMMTSNPIRARRRIASASVGNLQTFVEEALGDFVY